MLTERGIPAAHGTVKAGHDLLPIFPQVSWSKKGRTGERVPEMLNFILQEWEVWWLISSPYRESRLHPVALW